jgi:hypothetical protein
VKPDAIVYGPQANMCVEVERSHLTAPAAKSRITKALSAGVTSVWFTDTARNPEWLGQVPAVRLNPKIPWDRVPRPRTVSAAGVRRIVPRNCRTWTDSPCPRHKYGCTKWYPDHATSSGCSPTTSPSWSPFGKLVPMQFRTFDGRKQVLIVPAEGKALYEDWSATLPTCPSRRRHAPARRPGRKA